MPATNLAGSGRSRSRRALFQGRVGLAPRIPRQEILGQVDMPVFVADAGDSDQPVARVKDVSAVGRAFHEQLVDPVDRIGIGHVLTQSRCVQTLHRFITEVVGVVAESPEAGQSLTPVPCNQAHLFVESEPRKSIG